MGGRFTRDARNIAQRDAMESDRGYGVGGKRTRQLRPIL